MNRIRELREAKGLSADQLAAILKPPTSGAQIRRLEVGARKLTEEWMRRIAGALEVNPTDLLENASLAELCNEIEPISPKGMSNVARALANHRQMRLYRVKVPNLVDSGLARGQVFLADESPNALDHVGTGTIAVVELRPRHSLTTKYVAARIFIAPDLFVTNRPGNNLALKLNDLSIAVSVIGVMVPDSIEDGG